MTLCMAVCVHAIWHDCSKSQHRCCQPGPAPPRPDASTNLIRPPSPAASPFPSLQFAFNTLARISPVSHGVCNVVNRVVVIVSSGETCKDSKLPAVSDCLLVQPAQLWPLSKHCPAKQRGLRGDFKALMGDCRPSCQGHLLTSMHAERAAPVPPSPPPATHTVLVFGNELTLQTKLGTALTLLGTLAYSEAIRASRDKGAAAGSGAAPARLAVAPAAAQKRAQ